MTNDLLPVALSGEVTFQGQRVRSVMLDGEPWFSAQDVCVILEIADAAQAVRPLDPAQRRVLLKSDHAVSDTGCSSLFTGRAWRHTVINKAGLYRLVMRSDKPEAQAFQNWLAEVVLPSIDKHGGYIRGVEHLSPERQAVYHEETARLGFCAAEEREARDAVLRSMNKGRVRSKAQRDRAKVNRLNNRSDPRS